VVEEPEGVADLVRDARACVANLVGLPEDRDLLGEAVLQLGLLGRGQSWIVQQHEQLADAHVREQDRPARRLSRMGGQHQLERHVREAFAQRSLVDVRQPGERVGE
jgi:hypothetical protein